MYGIDSGKAYAAEVKPAPVIDNTGDEKPDETADDPTSVDPDDSPTPEGPGADDDTPQPGKRRRVTRVVTVDGFPVWAIVLIAVGSVVLVGGGLTLFLLLRKRKKHTAPPQ